MRALFGSRKACEVTGFDYLTRLPTASVRGSHPALRKLQLHTATRTLIPQDCVVGQRKCRNRWPRTGFSRIAAALSTRHLVDCSRSLVPSYRIGSSPMITQSGALCAPPRTTRLHLLCHEEHRNFFQFGVTLAVPLLKAGLMLSFSSVRVFAMEFVLPVFPGSLTFADTKTFEHLLAQLHSRTPLSVDNETDQSNRTHQIASNHLLR